MKSFCKAKREFEQAVKSFFFFFFAPPFGDPAECEWGAYTAVEPSPQKASPEETNYEPHEPHERLLPCILQL
jgi:hypothetical protein